MIKCHNLKIINFISLIKNLFGNSIHLGRVDFQSGIENLIFTPMKNEFLEIPLFRTIA